MNKILFKLGLITQKEYVIRRLLRMYNKALNVARHSNNAANLFAYLQKRNLHSGVCFASDHNLDISISTEDWVQRNKQPESAYWTASPWLNSTNINEILKALIIRINILKKELTIKG